MKKRRLLRAMLATAGAGLAVTCLTGCSLVRAAYYRHELKADLWSPAALDSGAGKPRLEVQNDIPVLHVYGSHTEMGTQYGTLLKAPLADLSGYLHAVLPKETLENFLELADRLEPALPAEMREELQAVSAASGLPFRELVALNAIPRLRCSALAVWDDVTPDGRLLMGRNGDYFGMGLSTRGSLMVVYHPDKGLAVLAINFLGMVGAFTGINEKGVAFANMLVFNSKVSGMNVNGASIQLLMRLAASRAGSAKEMATILEGEKHVIPMNVMVADPAEAVVLELGLDGAVERHGKDGVLAVTNDFLTPELRTEPRRCRRYDALVHAAAANRGKFTVATMKEALFAARMIDLNLHAVIFEPAAGRVHVSINRLPASAGPYATFDLKELFQQAAPCNR